MYFLRFILTIRSGPTRNGYIPLMLLVYPTLRLETKVLYHFYQLSNMIFVNVRSKLSEPQVDLFCDEAVNDGNRLAIAIKFCPDVHPSELTDYHAIVVDAFKDLFANKYIE